MELVMDRVTVVMVWYIMHTMTLFIPAFRVIRIVPVDVMNMEQDYVIALAEVRTPLSNLVPTYLRVRRVIQIVQMDAM